MAGEITLRVKGEKHFGWSEVTVTRSLEQLAHSFSVQLTDRWADQAKPVPIAAGDACWVAYGDQGVVVTNGWIEEDTLQYDANGRTLGFSGRSLTGDLVDCAAVHKGGQWKKVTLLQIAKDLCAPFEIGVQTATDLGAPFSLFKLEPGETVFACLERAARMRGVLMTTFGDGSLVFERAGTTKVSTVLEYGKNIKSCQKRTSMTERFSRYTIRAQMSAGGAPGENFSGANLTMSRHSDDSRVARYRPTIISAETEDSGPELQKRADWERNVRAGRARRLTYTVEGWEHSAGLWEPNRLVHVTDPQVPVDDDLLIVSATQRRSDQGTTTDLELVHPAAFTVQPLPPKPAKKAPWDV